MEPKQTPVGLSSVVDNLKTTCQGGECNLFCNVADQNVSKISKLSKISKHNTSVSSKKPEVIDISGGNSQDFIFGFPRRVVFIAVTIAFVVFLYLWLKRRDSKRLQNIKDNLITSEKAAVVKPRSQPPILPPEQQPEQQPVPRPQPPTTKPVTKPVTTPAKNPTIKPVITKKPPPKPAVKKPTLLRKPAQNPLAGKKVSAQPIQRARPAQTPRPPPEKQQAAQDPEEDFTYLKDL